MTKQRIELHPGQVMGKLTLIKPTADYKWLCRCSCGNISEPYVANLRRGFTKSCGHCSKNSYFDCDDGISVRVIATNGIAFYIDKSDEPIVKQHKWSVTSDVKGNMTVITSDRMMLHTLLLNTPKGMEVDHIDLDRLNNRRNNLRLCTHQQNQCNQPLQANNTSGVTGVSYFAPRGKYRARIKVFQHDIHLGYYALFEDAVKARNIGMHCMFGEYGIYNETDAVPEWIIEKVITICKRFVGLSTCKAFIDYVQNERRRENEQSCRKGSKSHTAFAVL